MKSGKMIATNGIRLNVAEAGNPESPHCLLFLHGFPDFHYGWRFQAAFFDEKKCHVLMPDLRGYNLSDKPAKVTDYALEVLAQDIQGLLNTLGKKVWLVGQDWGGALAWQVAQTWPDLIHGLIVLNTPHPEVFWQQLKDHKETWLKNTNWLFYQVPGLAEKILSSGDWVHFSQQFKEKGKKGTITEADLKKYREAWSQPGAFKAMLNWYRAALKHRPPQTTLKIEVPTLFIQGKKDATLTAEMVKDSLARCQREVKHHVFPHAGKWVHLDQAEALNDLILEFIQTHGVEK